MDMKRILQAMDGVATKPVAGANDMTRFLSIIDKNDVSILNEGANPHKVSLPVQMAMQHYQQPQKPKQEKPSILKKYLHDVEEELAEEKTQKQQLMRQYASVIAERVMMKESVLKNKEDLQAKRKALHDLSLNKDVDQKAVQQRKLDLEKEAKKKGIGEHTVPGHSMGFKPGAGPGMQETPIAMNTDEPNNPMIHSHEKANPMHLKDRISQARSQLRELAELAESNDLLVWERITRLAQGGMFMGLEQNLEQIRHGIEELAKKRKQGGVNSRGVDKHIGESELKPMAPMKAAKPKAIKAKAKTSPCRSGQVQTGTQIKNGKVVPKCSVR
jgi:phosphopantetheinyl transferase (holo-ACP synthase)